MKRKIGEVKNERAIIVRELVKNFESIERGKGLTGKIKSLYNPKKKKVEALRGISFSIDKGELVGFIGPNGAGKTTTLKCLSGLLHPTQGAIEVLGYKPFSRKHEYLKQ